MAILNALPGFEVTILVDGKPLKEYTDGDEEDEPKSLTRFVEAVTGGEFEVQLKIAKGTQITREVASFSIRVDGILVIRPIVAKKKFRKQDYVSCKSGRQLGGGDMQKLCFSELETVSDGHMKKDEKSRAKDLGTIAVRVSFKDKSGYKRPMRVKEAFSKDPSIVSEKALKGRALTHGIGFKAPQPGGHTESQSCVNEDPDNIYQFCFTYRSLKALKDMLIIEPTPEPIPLEERDFDSLTRDQQKEVHKLFQNRARAEKAGQEATKRIKRERQDDNPRPRKVARPSAGSQLLEIDETGGGFREAYTDTLPRIEPEIIEID